MLRIALSLTGPVNEVMSLLPELSRQGINEPTADVINEDAGGGIATGRLTMSGPLQPIAELLRALSEFERNGGIAAYSAPTIRVGKEESVPPPPPPPPRTAS
jgi:hypothetical protein